MTFNKFCLHLNVLTERKKYRKLDNIADIDTVVCTILLRRNFCVCLLRQPSLPQHITEQVFRTILDTMGRKPEPRSPTAKTKFGTILFERTFTSSHHHRGHSTGRSSRYPHSSHTKCYMWGNLLRLIQ